jgi:signal peptidase I
MKINRAWFRKEVAPILLALVLVTAARSSLADHYYVPSGSMENTLFPGDRVVVDKTAYGWRIPLSFTNVRS